MATDMIVTVRDVLDQPLYKQSSKLIAGSGGLDRSIRWVHILETSKFDSLIHGGELILTTGIGLQVPSERRSYIERLIDRGVSGLCIELGEHLDSVPEEITDIADRSRFPIIVFTETVRFVDITRDLHSLIINRRQRMLDRMESVSKQLHKLTLSSQGTTEILMLLHAQTGKEILWQRDGGTPQLIPATGRPNKHDALMRHIERHLLPLNGQSDPIAPVVWTDERRQNYLLQPVGALGVVWAALALILDEADAEEFDRLVIEKASQAIAHILLRKQLIEEKKLLAENDWLFELIEGRVKTDEQLRAAIGSTAADSAALGYRLCVIEAYAGPGDSEAVDAEKEQIGTFQLHLSLIIRSAFESGGFRVFMATRGNQSIMMTVGMKSGKSEKDRLKQALETVSAANLGVKTEIRMLAGVSRRRNTISDAGRSYREALDVLKAFRRKVAPDFFYEHLGVYRLLLNEPDDDALAAFVDDYIGPVIAYDRTRDGQLLLTLETYLDHDGSKQQTASKLFTVRQTVYHRIAKLEELLGHDFMSPEKRLAISLALRAHRMLGGQKLHSE